MDRHPRPPLIALRLHRFYVPPEAVGGGRVAFSPAQRHQLRRVLRLRPGDRALAFDGSGAEYLVALEGPECATATILRRAQPAVESPVRLALYQALLKPPAFDLVLQKATELGAARIVPVLAQRCVARCVPGERKAHWWDVAREAAEQSGRVHVPEIAPATPFAAALASGPRPAILCDPSGPHPLAATPAAPEVALFIGPEGGFTSEEIDAARQAGAIIASLGPRTLRAETAAVAGCALLALRVRGSEQP